MDLVYQYLFCWFFSPGKITQDHKILIKKKNSLHKNAAAAGSVFSFGFITLTYSCFHLSSERVKAAGELCHRLRLERDAFFWGAADCSLQLWPLPSNTQRSPGSAGTDAKQHFCKSTRATEGLTSAWKSCSLCCSVMLFSLWIFTEVKAWKLIKIAEQTIKTWGQG